MLPFDVAMAVTESDISWPLLRQIVAGWAGPSADLAAVEPLHGGCVNTTLHLTLTDGRHAVIKLTQHRVNQFYRDESHQLSIMRDLGIPVPEVFQCTIGTLDQPHSYLLMQFVPGVDLHKARAICTPEEYEDLQKQLADYTARLHNVTHEAYGKVHAEGPPPTDGWASMYQKLYEPILKACQKSPLLGVKCKRRLEKIHDKLPRLLQHDDRPRLTHWDLWAGNVLAEKNGDGRWHITALLDPNCKFAHAEAEIAYMELFHTANSAFMHAYQDTHKLPPDYHRVRKPVYQLFELANHVQMFGQEYVKPMCATLDRVPA